MADSLGMLIAFLSAAVLASTPLIYATVGEIITQKAGNLNLGVEGMMYMGAIAGFWICLNTGSLIAAVLGSFIAGGLGALIYAFLTVTLKANQNVTGLILTIFGTGFANFCGDYLMFKSASSFVKLPEDVTARVIGFKIPLLSEIKYLGQLLFQYNMFVYLGVIIAVVAGLYLNKTKKGLNLRAVGENPAAADAAGINVPLNKYVHIIIGGGLCGIGGMYIALMGSTWTNNCVNGLGWLAVALVIFASWSPVKAISGSILFGALRVVRFYVPGSVKNLINIPTAFYTMLPYLVTVLVLIAASIKMAREKQQPRGCGVNYFREER